MSTNDSNFRIVCPNITIGGQQFDTSQFVSSVIGANRYLAELQKIFDDLEVPFFNIINQRNLSGFVGEVFCTFCCRAVEELVGNPHPDGRPDILHVPNDAIRRYVEFDCFEDIDGRRIPIKSMFTPFKYTGLEVKCTIGDKKAGLPGEIGQSRVENITGLTYWAHHVHTTSLLGLYFDYYHPGGVPQILAAFYSQLDDSDWGKLSTGNPQNKKTSNTSTNKHGRKKLYDNCLLVVNDERYIDRMRALGVTL